MEIFFVLDQVELEPLSDGDVLQVLVLSQVHDELLEQVVWLSVAEVPPKLKFVRF